MIISDLKIKLLYLRNFKDILELVYSKEKKNKFLKFYLVFSQQCFINK